MTDEQELSEEEAKRVVAQALPDLYRLFVNVEVRLNESPDIADERF